MVGHHKSLSRMHLDIDQPSSILLKVCLSTSPCIGKYCAVTLSMLVKFLFELVGGQIGEDSWLAFYRQ